MRHPAVPEHLRGTFSGMSTPHIVEYIRSLGVTSVELMPIHAFTDDRHLQDKGLHNFWGYNTLSFFAPHPQYMATHTVNEFKQMIATFHAAGIEVILDVVYNHTAEGNELGPTLSFKGIDNASYYRLMPDNKRYYINDTGTGNTLNLSHPRVLQMVTDSLRYWATEMQVDGFRFDLATILGRESYGFDEGCGFLDTCRQDPILSQCKLIAEPWDCGPGGYQVGGFPPGWMEWNDRFRDTVRKFWRGDEGQLAQFATRLSGSADLFNHRGRKPYASVNFITAHDGFTLNDWVSYEKKHNEANGENGKDGSDNNISANYGVEGPTDDPEISELRLRQMRNMLATLLFSQGTPMLLAGDEFARSQNGNNNAYCQDTEIAWVNWNIGDKGQSLLLFTYRLIALRKRFPILHRGRFLTGAIHEKLDVKDVSWFQPAKYMGVWWSLHIDKETWGTGSRHGATTANTKRVIDFAANNGFRGVLVEGWNLGWDGDWFANGWGFDFRKPTPDYDLQGLAKYATSKGVHLIGHHETGCAVSHYESQMDEAFSLFATLGIDAVKTGYVCDAGQIERQDVAGGPVLREWHEGQWMSNHHLRVVEDAAKHHVAIDAHEPIKDTGLRRTYPNWVSREGARGMEFNAWGDPPNPPEHEITLVFTRMLAGPMDYTPGVLSLTGKNGQEIGSTLARQLALYIGIYSPIQMAADLPEHYAAHPDAFQFIKDVAVDWDESHVLAGEVGEYVAIARKQRGAGTWFIGAMNDRNARTLALPLAFLDAGKRYRAEIYRDGEGADWHGDARFRFVREQRTVTSKDALSLWLAGGGGAAVRFVPLDG